MDPPPPSVEPPREGPRPALLAAALAVGSVLPFAGALGGGFVFDDHLLVERASRVRALGDLAALWREELWAGTHALHARYLRPLATTSYALDGLVFRGNATGYHLTNLVLHALATLLAFSALRRWTGRVGAAAAAAWLWAWLPSKVEAVAWISGRTDLLCAIGLLAMAAAAARRLAGGGRAFAIVEAIALAAALASKELAIVAPAFVAIEAWSARGRRPIDGGEVAAIARAAAPHAAVVAAYAALRAAFFPMIPAGAGSLPAADQARYALETIGELSRIAIAPWPLSIERAPIQLDGAGAFAHDSLRTVLGLVAVAAVVVGIVGTRLRRPGVAIGLALAAAALFPVANVVPTHAPFLAAERFAYVPTLGLALALAAALPGASRLAIGTVAAAAVAMLPSDRAHTDDLLDDASLWRHELALRPDLPPAVRFACGDALAHGREREAFDLATRGLASVDRWLLPQPYRVELVLCAAEALGRSTPLSDRATLAQLDAFYDAFFAAKGAAALDVRGSVLGFDASGPEAALLRRAEPAQVRAARLSAATTAARLGRCDRATSLARELARDGDPLDRASAARVLSRCGAWDEALALVEEAARDEPSLAKTAADLRRARRLLASGGESAAPWADRVRAWLVVGDGDAAWRAIRGEGETVAVRSLGGPLVARAAWMAREDGAARELLATSVGADRVEATLSGFSRDALDDE